MNHQSTVTIKTKRLVLRRFTYSDVEPSFENWASDKKVTRFMRWQPHESTAVTKDILGSWISQYENDDFYQWAIVLKETGEVIGTIGVVGKNENTDMVHIGYCIGSKWWHQGITSEALSEIIPFFFDKVCVRRIESMHDPENIYSGMVMKKCGLKYEGTLRQSDYNNKGIVDAAYYALLRDEYKSRR